MPIQKAKDDLTRLEAEIIDLEAKLLDARGRAQKIRDFIEMFPVYADASEIASPASKPQAPVPAAAPSEPPEKMEPSDSVVVVALPKTSPFYGMSLADAAFVALGTKGMPLTAAEIVRELRNGGWVFTAKNPSVTLYWALRERSLKLGDVINIPGSRWSLQVWRPDDERLKATRTGLAAARARGVKLGPPSRFTDAMKAQADEMLRAGAKVSVVARQIGISPQAIYYWLNRRNQEQPDLVTAAALGANRPH